MNRRNWLKGAVALPALAVFNIPSSALGVDAPLHRVRPTDPSWPSQADWDALARSLSGKLIKSPALLADCASDPSSAACKTTLVNLHNPYFIGDQPSGTQVSGWFNAWAPAPSAYVVLAESATDVAAAVNFARNNRLRLVVKGGGHSYQGTSNAADSLLVWTRAMRKITMHDQFIPQGCSQRPLPAVTIESGAMWIDAYDAVTTRAGRYVQGGGCATVGVAGLIQSGGFGSFSKQFGMAAASLLEAEVVTAEGEIRVANSCLNSDLFWALKGGGGGSFCVVTKLTFRTHDLPECFGGAGGTIKAVDDAAFRELIGRFMEFYADNLLNPHWGESITLKPNNSLEISMASAGLSAADCEAVFKTFFDWVSASPGKFSFTDDKYAGATPARSWWDPVARAKRGSKAMTSDDRPDSPPTHAWWKGDQEQVGAYLYGYDSLWLPELLLKNEYRERLTDALIAASRHVPAMLHFNKGLAGAPTEAVDAARSVATNPDVLNAFALAIVAAGSASRYPNLPGAPTDTKEPTMGARAVDLAMAELRKLAPNGGSYVSESNYFNPNWSKDFWSANYARLQAVKQKYDPGGLFFVHHGVGSEEWSADGFTHL
jgi:FAD/FMN-containing dehydrogenase